MNCSVSFSTHVILHRDKLLYILILAVYKINRVSDKHASIFYRLSALQARASKRLTWGLACYLPVIFFVYGFLLGTAYFQKQAPALVMSGFCVYSVASALFMFPILFNYYNRALEVYMNAITMVIRVNSIQYHYSGPHSRNLF